MKSPCVDVCVMDAQRGLCEGCLRTLDEITRWSGMTDAERDRVLAELPARRGGAKTASSREQTGPAEAS